MSCVLAWLGGPVVASSTLPAPCVASAGLSAGAVIGGSTLTGIVMLGGPAPSGGLAIHLSSSNPNAQVSEQVTAQPGQTSAAFAVSTAPVTTSMSVTITAVAGSCSASAGVTVQAAVLEDLSLAANITSSNAGLTGTATLSGPAPSGGAVVKLQSSEALVNLPASVTIPAGEMSAGFALTTGLSLSSNNVAITASYGSSAKTALLTVQPLI